MNKTLNLVGLITDIEYNGVFVGVFNEETGEQIFSDFYASEKEAKKVLGFFTDTHQGSSYLDRFKEYDSVKFSWSHNFETERGKEILRRNQDYLQNLLKENKIPPEQVIKILTPKPICKIINDSFSYRLEVDNQYINFDGSSNAGYFKSLYERLGYEVIFDLDFYKRKAV